MDIQVSGTVFSGVGDEFRCNRLRVFANALRDPEKSTKSRRDIGTLRVCANSFCQFPTTVDMMRRSRAMTRLAKIATIAGGYIGGDQFPIAGAETCFRTRLKEKYVGKFPAWALPFPGGKQIRR